MSNENAHINGKYAIYVAIIGLIGSLGAVFLNHYLEEDPTPFNPIHESEESKAIENEAKMLLADFIGYWEDKDLDGMENLLHDSFYYTDRDINKQWKNAFIAEKRKLFSKHRWIKIKTSEVKISLVDIRFPKGVIEYFQYYDTPTYESRGLNKLTFRKYGDNYQITKEEFNKDYSRSK